MSHTKLDEEFCNKFDVVAARVGVIPFRSEFEEIKPPAWKTIKDAMNKSSALFLLIGKKLVKSQTSSEVDEKAREEWKFTQNWIAYEIGLACQRGIDVWVVCDSISINFPVPYLNNYEIWGIHPKTKHSLSFWKGVFTDYRNGRGFPVNRTRTPIECPHCKAVFNLHSILPENMQVICPTCLRTMVFSEGWLL